MLSALTASLKSQSSIKKKSSPSRPWRRSSPDCGHSVNAVREVYTRMLYAQSKLFLLSVKLDKYFKILF